MTHSPVVYAHQMRTPTLLMHAEQDWQVPVGQSEQMFAALKRFGCPVEYVRYPDAGHGMSRSGPPAYRVDRLERIVRWLGKYL